MTQPKRFSFSLRAMISLTLTFSFLIVAASSCALFCMKRLGQTSMLGVARSDWAILHSVLGCFFLAALMVHVLINIKALIQYFRKGLTAARSGMVELLLALLLVAAFTATAMLDVPPARWITKRPPEITKDLTPLPAPQPQSEPYDPTNDSGAAETHATPEE
jgi:succinate dehydrogenase/fumarate reductase cytochrome b subunit